MEETGARLLSAGEFLLDSSALRLLPGIAETQDPHTPTLLISYVLDNALASDDGAHALALVKELVHARGRNADALAREILAAYSYLRDRQTIQVLEDRHGLESDACIDRIERFPEVEVAPGAGSSAELSAANANAILRHSAATGTPILMKNRGLPNSLRRRATIVEIADQVESLFGKKQELAARLFGRRHTKAMKFFVGAVITVGGFWFPPLGFAGAAFALLDP